MDDLSILQTCLIGVIFTWSGFVRSGLGFGSAVLALPVLLLVLHDPLYFIPVLAVQTLFFTFITVVPPYFQFASCAAYNMQLDKRKLPAINWRVLKICLSIIIIPKLLGVIGLVTPPAYLVRLIIFGVVSVYAISYILNRPFASQSRKLDAVFLTLSGYIHGTSLMGSRIP